MKTFVAILALLAVVLVMPAMAKKNRQQQQDSGPELKIVEVNAVSVTVTLGKTGDEHVQYKINDGTKITLNGAPVAARELRPGMVAKIEAGQDKVATAIHAKDAPTHPDRHHVG